jgi:hypothetical protein
MEQLNTDAMAQVIAIVLIAVSRQLDSEQLRRDLLVLADAPGPNAIPGVREVVTALTRLLPDAPPGSDSPG